MRLGLGREIMRSYRYFHLDVFSETLFGGNQLAVFLDARNLSTEQMQAIAKEMNFSETTFILPAESEETDVRMRIFTPAEELALAGHPTIGSTFALARSGAIEPGQTRPFVFGLGVGPIPVALTWSPAAVEDEAVSGSHATAGTPRELLFAWMSQPVPKFSATASDEDVLSPEHGIVAALGIDSSDMNAKLPVQIGSAGLPFLYVPLTSREAVDRSKLNFSKLQQFYNAAGIGEAKGCFVFSTEAGADKATVYSRMYAPNLGIPEDPATGSASGPLGCYLVLNGAVPIAEAGSILNLQGVKMGRRSSIYISISVAEAGGEVTEVGPGGLSSTDSGCNSIEIDRVQVGGKSVTAGEGTIFL